MQTQAYFDDIKKHLLYELNKATSSIAIAIAWFTDKEILQLLCDKATSKVRVELILIKDSINEAGLDFDELRSKGGSVHLINKRRGKAIMHNKFCVIDAETVVTGSYNWSYQAQQNDENITVIREHPVLARQFMDEFDAIRQRHGIEDGSADHGKVLTRLEALKTVIELEDADDIAMQLAKLKKVMPTGNEYDSARAIIEQVEKGHHSAAMLAIVAFIASRKQIVDYVDPELSELKLELKVLEIQISAMQDEKADMDKQLHAFQFRYAVELGPLVREILKMRYEHLKQKLVEDPTIQEAYEKAKKDYEQFEHDCDESTKRKVMDLSPELLQELKAKFRASSKLCHPDVVAPEHKVEAQKLFAQLNEANEKNDLETITKIYNNLQQGIFVALSETVSDSQRLHREVVRMRERVTALNQEISLTRNSESYRKLSSIADWDVYFSESRTKLEQDKERLQLV